MKISLKTKIILLNVSICILATVLSFELYVCSFADEGKKQQLPVTVDGDNVEYLSETKEVSATGNVVVDYKGTKLMADKLTVNTETKDAKTEGPTRVEDNDAVVEGSQISYNFADKTGTITDAKFRSSPYFGKAKEMKKVSDKEFVGYRGYATTCAIDSPHYRIGAKRINLFPNDKIKTKHDKFFIANVPLAYLPFYNHSLKDPMYHIQMTPGKSKDWGPYLLTATRYNITNKVTGRLYLDQRSKIGTAGGFGANYNTDLFGKGDLKFYYTQERSPNYKEWEQAEFQRYFIRSRHRWEIDPRTILTSEYFKIVDSKMAIYSPTSPHEYNVLKDFFPREYGKDPQPLSYVTVHHNFDYLSVDAIVQKRVNRWYTETEKLPEVKYSLPSLQFGDTPFYFENTGLVGSYNKKNPVPSDSVNDVDLFRFDTTNKVSLPMKIAFFSLTPFVSDRTTYWNKDINGAAINPRTVFYSGADISTKFYRLFDVKTNFLGLDLNGIRHIVTPTVGYKFNHEPTILTSKLRNMDTDDVEDVSRNNSATLELLNKFQTKRGEGDDKKKTSVDIANFKISTIYKFKPKGGGGSGFSESILYDLELFPYSWMRVDADLTYNHYEDYVPSANYDINFTLASERSFGLGQRYAYSPTTKVNNELTYNLKWRLNPKWMLFTYHIIRVGHQTSSYKTGLREQEYTISRNLHCWDMDITYNVKRGEGNTIWLIFRLKAFPEIEFDFNKSYNAPKSGSQANQ